MSNDQQDPTAGKTEEKVDLKPKTVGVAATPKVVKQAPPAPPKNAAQKLEALEQAFVRQNQQITILADEIDRLRETVVALNKRLNASIQAGEQGNMSNESVNKIILGENMKELESKVNFLVEQGVLVRNDEAEISDKTFVVGREVDAQGNVTNPRVQFAISTVDPSVKDKFLSRKAGDVIAFSETDDSVEITEVYEMVDLKKKKNFEKTTQPTK